MTKLDFNQTAVMEFVIDAMKQVAKHQEKMGGFDSLEICETKVLDHPKDDDARYFKVDGQYVIRGSRTCSVSISAAVTIRWAKGAATLAGHIKWQDERYTAIQSDGFRHEGRFLEVWADAAEKIDGVFLDSLDGSGAWLIADLKGLNERTGPFKAMPAEIVTKEGDYFPGNFNQLNPTRVFMDLGYKSVSFPWENIEVMWMWPV